MKEIYEHKETNAKWILLVLLEANKETCAPLNIIRCSDPVTMAKYTRENTLTKSTGWK